MRGPSTLRSGAAPAPEEAHVAREWGVSEAVRLEPDASGRALALTLAPARSAYSGGR